MSVHWRLYNSAYKLNYRFIQWWHSKIDGFLDTRHSGWYWWVFEIGWPVAGVALLLLWIYAILSNAIFAAIRWWYVTLPAALLGYLLLGAV